MFQHYSDPLICSGHLTDTNHDIEFWYSFHPHDCDILWQCLLAMFPVMVRLMLSSLLTLCLGLGEEQLCTKV
jgi:hypothetical protein